MKYILYTIFLLASACSSTHYFIVRHGEKTILAKDSAGMMANNPPLSEAGKQRAITLKNELLHRHIRHIYSTNTIRTISTAEPLSKATGIAIELYNTKDSLDSFIKKLKTMRGNILVVGHSNTVDDIVNKLCGEIKIPSDLKDSEYDNLFTVKRKGRKMIFSRRRYGSR